MYEELVKRLRYCSEEQNGCGMCALSSDCVLRVGLLTQAADAIEERDRYALTLQHEMMAEAESHIALVERLNKQIKELQKQVAYWQAQLTKSMCGETLAELEKPRWIPATEEPPLKVGDDGYNGYLVYANGYYEVADYTVDKFDNVPYFHVDGEYEYGVTHYMPLPEPPEEET